MSEVIFCVSFRHCMSIFIHSSGVRNSNLMELETLLCYLETHSDIILQSKVIHTCTLRVSGTRVPNQSFIMVHARFPTAWAVIDSHNTLQLGGWAPT